MSVGQLLLDSFISQVSGTPPPPFLPARHDKEAPPLPRLERGVRLQAGICEKQADGSVSSKVNEGGMRRGE